MRLSQVCGQEQAVRLLLQGLQQRRVAHAYMFSGPQGVGKKTTARAFAQSILCLDVKNGDACQVCPSCLQFQGDNHPDYFWIAPEGASVKIDQIRNLQKRIRYRPYVSSHQVAVIEQAETMQAPAANALLKVLEEPPGPTIFILLTDRGHGMLPTILSRCMPVYFRRVPGEQIAHFIREHGADSQQISLLTLLSGGRWDKAAKLLAEGLPEGREKAKQLLNVIPQAGDSELFRLAEEWDKNKEGLAELLDYMALLMRDRLLIASDAIEDLVINQDQLNDAAHWRPTALMEGLERVMEARRLLDTNASGRLLLENTLMKLRDLAQVC